MNKFETTFGDRQGKDSLEKPTMRPAEDRWTGGGNGNGGGGSGSSAHTQAVKSAVNQIVGTGQQDLQKQLDRCRDFCRGIDTFETENTKAVQLIRENIEESVRRNLIGNFTDRMNQHLMCFNDKINESLVLLNGQRNGFSNQACHIINKMNAIKQTPQYKTSNISGGLASETNNIFKK